MPTGFYPRPDLKMRLLSRIKVVGECWEYGGAIGTHGYGRIGEKNKVIQAHRASWIIHFGQVPDGLWVLHKCDNRKCVNPSHLFLGDRRINIDDCISKGRTTHGEKSFLSKLRIEQVRAIRRVWSTGRFPQRIIAERFGIDQSTVSYIVSGKTWKRAV